MRFTVLFLVSFLVVHAGAEKLPMGGEPVKFEEEFLQWRQRGGRSNAEIDDGRASGMPFKKILKVTVKEQTKNSHSISLRGLINGQIKQGDVLLLSMYARCERSDDESSLGRFTISSMLNLQGEYIRPFTKTYSVGKKWKRFLIPFDAPRNNKEGIWIALMLGGTKPQRLQFGDLQILNYRDKKTLAELPITEVRYPGIEPDAPWRKAAAKRIDEHRKEMLAVRVLDKYGRPVRGAKVQVKQTSHSFGFGAAIGLPTMFGRRNPDDAQKYRDAVEGMFNKVTIENSLKWKHYDVELVDEALAWLKERGIPVRGHCLVWPAWQRIPSSLHHYKKKPNEFRTVVEDRVREASSQWPGAFPEWDVVNELYSQHEFVDLLGKEVVVDWFRIAKEARPEFKNYINDYSILAGYHEEHQNHYYEWIEYLIAKKAPLDGIGFQGHYRAPVPPEEILRRIDRFAEFGLEMQITEFDFEETDELLQARFTRDFMTAIFSHPQMTGIITWCVWEDAASKPDAAFFSKDWKKKKIALAWEYMINKEWHTEATATAGANGIIKLRGFLGDYEVTVSQFGRKKIVPFKLEKGKGLLTVKLD
ncbi:MAG: endo-1,4-beta-xylanase [Kiritimatiellales bacterium]|nr:endo-1,4-beta-xylanase [Kiritimatiellales bacterium]